MIYFSSLAGMEFPPPDWTFHPVEEMDTYVSQFVRQGQRAFEATIRFDRLVASHMRLHIGGGEALKPRWSAEAILGDKFSGNVFFHP